MGLGVCVKLGQKLTLAADYTSANWKDFKYFGQSAELAQLTRYSAGMQFIPDPTRKTRNFLKMTNYRLGFRYANTHLLVKQQQLNEYGISFGVGIPLVQASPNTYLHVAVEYGQRGYNTTGLITEQFTRFGIGFSFTPHKFDRWFYKPKID